MAYWTGMRAGEILKLQWTQVDIERGLLRLEPGTTKNNRGRLIPLVKEVTEALWQWKQHMLHRYPYRPWVCHYRGKRLLAVPTKSWKKACEQVGFKEKLFHDLRRTGVRNLLRAGISERVAMEISGHKTRSVFDRYNIISEGDLVEAQRRLEGFWTKTSADPNLAAIDEGRVLLTDRMD
jgi:integrase